MTRSILPPNSTRLERALEIVSDRLAAPAVDSLWDAWLAPERFLPWLAYAVGVREWDPLWPLETRRQVIASQIAINRHRGTSWAVRQSLIAMGYADAALEEGYPEIRRDGTTQRDGSNTRDSAGRWAFFRIVADLGNNKGINETERRRLISLIEAAKPVRSVLKELAYTASVSDEVFQDEQLALDADFTFADLVTTGVPRDGSVRRDGGHNHEYQADTIQLAADLKFSDSHRATTPNRVGRFQRDGSALRGPQTAACLESVALAVAVKMADQHDPATEELNFSADLSLVEHPLTTRPRNGSIARDGTVTRDASQDSLQLSGEISWAEAHRVFSDRSGVFRRDGQLKRGSGNAWAGDSISLVITRRRFRDGRLTRNGSHLRSAQYSYDLTA